MRDGVRLVRWPLHSADASSPSTQMGAAGLMTGVIGFVLIYLANKVAHRLGEQGVYR